jgi:threonine/homoserine/homoserine lactone efflux protein
VIRIIFTLLMIAAIAFILYAAFKYLTAMGDAAKVQEAHRALLWAAVAIAVALIATGVRSIVNSVLQGR